LGNKGTDVEIDSIALWHLGWKRMQDMGFQFVDQHDYPVAFFGGLKITG